MNKYIVRYAVGSKFGEINVEAHTKEQAKEIARIQVRWGLKEHGTFEVLSVRQEGKRDPLLKKIYIYKE